MSFASDVKDNCIKDKLPLCCERGEAYGLLINASTLSAKGIRMVTESFATVKRFSVLLDKLCKCAVEITANGAGYVATVDEEHTERVLSYFSVNPQDMALRLNRANLENDCCTAAFVRGSFLAVGHAADPQKAYRVEFVTRHKQLAADFATLLGEQGLSPAIQQRQSKMVLYYKHSEKVLELLTFMGANKNAFDIINTKIEKQFRNKANRMANSDAANIRKTVEAAGAQMDVINSLMESGGISLLPVELQEVASLRYENPESSLTELAEVSGMARSKVNRLLTKLTALGAPQKK